MENAFMVRAGELRLESTLRRLGKRDDIHEVMRAADMLLLTSDQEGLPNVVLEAQCAGIPVVATRAGGTEEAVREGRSALLAAPGDVEALVRHCHTILRDANLRVSMGAVGREFILNTFSIRQLGDKTLMALGLPSVP